MDVTFERITPEESWATFDAAAQRVLQISGQDFAQRWDAGEYNDDDSVEVMQVAMLRPSGR